MHQRTHQQNSWTQEETSEGTQKKMPAWASSLVKTKGTDFIKTSDKTNRPQLPFISWDLTKKLMPVQFASKYLLLYQYHYHYQAKELCHFIFKQTVQL